MGLVHVCSNYMVYVWKVYTHYFLLSNRMGGPCITFGDRFVGSTQCCRFPSRKDAHNWQRLSWDPGILAGYCHWIQHLQAMEKCTWWLKEAKVCTNHSVTIPVIETLTQALPGVPLRTQAFLQSICFMTWITWIFTTVSINGSHSQQCLYLGINEKIRVFDIR